MQFPWHLEKDLRWRRGYVEERMEVQSLEGIKMLFQLHRRDHMPITALQSSSVRSNL